MVANMRNVSLDSPLLFSTEIPSFSAGGVVETAAPLNIEDYLVADIPTPPIPTDVANANPNPQIIQTAQQPAVTQDGLTELEKTYLSPEEQQIILRQRGMIT